MGGIIGWKVNYNLNIMGLKFVPNVRKVVDSVFLNNLRMLVGYVKDWLNLRSHCQKLSRGPERN